MFQLLEAKSYVSHKKQQLKQKAKDLKNKGITPKLVVFLLGEDPASKVYVEHKQKLAEEIGALCDIIQLPHDSSSKEFLKKLDTSNKDPNVHGILVQQPLPQHISQCYRHDLIDPKKDVDGFHPLNQGKLVTKELDGHIPCTPKGILNLLKHHKISPEGLNVVVIGRSPIVGKPLSLVLLNANATVTICHSKSKDLVSHTKNADLIVVACGKKHLLSAEHIGSNKPIVIDVGIHRNQNGSLSGDVDLQAIQDKLSAASPVPGGVGPMTVISLMENLFNACERG